MLSYCIEKAQEGHKQGRVRVFCVAADKHGRILAESSNRYDLTHPVQAKYAKKAGQEHRIYLHAEIAVLCSIARQRIDTEKVVLYIARVGAKGNPLPACPCPVCSLALQEAGIRKIVTT